MKGALLKILAVVSFAAVIIPFIIGADTNVYGNLSPLRIIIYYAVGSVFSVLGYIGAQLSKTHKKLRIPVKIFGILIAGAGFLSFPLNGDGEMVFSLAIMFVFMYYIGNRAGHKNFADMYPLTAFGAYIFIAVVYYIFALLSSEHSGMEPVPDIILFSFVLEFAAAALLVNQSNIYERANMRKETKTSLPKGLTAYNAALVLGFTVTGMLLCVFRKYIAWFLEQCGLILIKAIVGLFSLFRAEKMEVVSGEPGEPASFMNFMNSPLGNITKAIAVIGLIVIIVVFRKKILNAIKAFFSRLGALFSGHTEDSEQPEFTDVFENFTSDSRSRIKNDNIYAVKRKYSAETDPREKYRLGYRVLLYRIKAVNQRLSHSDTTSVQAERGYEHFGKNEMDGTVSVYDGVRYSTDIPDKNQLEELHTLVVKQ